MPYSRSLDSQGALESFVAPGDANAIGAIRGVQNPAKGRVSRANAAALWSISASKRSRP